MRRPGLEWRVAREAAPAHSRRQRRSSHDASARHRVLLAQQRAFKQLECQARTSAVPARARPAVNRLARKASLCSRPPALNSDDGLASHGEDSDVTRPRDSDGLGQHPSAKTYRAMVTDIVLY